MATKTIKGESIMVGNDNPLRGIKIEARGEGTGEVDITVKGVFFGTIGITEVEAIRSFLNRVAWDE